jgi:hypothetical protein
VGGIRRTKAKAPKQTVYALFRDGLEFVHLFVNTRSDDTDALTELDSFKAYARDVRERCEAPPQPMHLTFELLGSYGLD